MQPLHLAELKPLELKEIASGETAYPDTNWYDGVALESSAPGCRQPAEPGHLRRCFRTDRLCGRTSSFMRYKQKPGP